VCFTVRREFELRQLAPEIDGARRAPAAAPGAATIAVSSRTESSKPVRTLIGEAERIFRRSLVEVLEASGLAVVAECATGEEVVRLAGELRPDIVVLDDDLTDISASDAMSRILAFDPSVKVLALTAVLEEARMVEALAAGACGYLLKTVSVDTLVAAIRCALAGGSLIIPWDASGVLERAGIAGDGLKARLSGREIQVLRLVAEGRDNGEIAAELVISPRTVKDHVSHILEKLGAENRTEAAVCAVRRGIV
jgi:NarL family two-component system response regulator LiaR